MNFIMFQKVLKLILATSRKKIFVFNKKCSSKINKTKAINDFYFNIIKNR